MRAIVLVRLFGGYVNNKPINVFSACDGISCGRLALARVGIKVGKYIASEIDKHAIKISSFNYPEIIHVGDLTEWRTWDVDWSTIDLIMGGTPCQGFSFSGKQLAFDDPRSKLFFTFADILDHVKTVNPNVKFLLENVKMKKEYEAVISERLGVEPILINSALVSAQNRRRLYWTNWPTKLPEDKGILLRDIVHENTACDREKAHCLDANYFKGSSFETYVNKSRRQLVFALKPYMVPLDKSLHILEVEKMRGKIGYFRSDSQANRVYSIHGKSVTLCGDAGGGAAKMGQYLFGCITPDRMRKSQNGQRFSVGDKFYTLTATDQHGILVDGYIRKLTPVECERLQTIPEMYTAVVSDHQRYRSLGNGWTIDVIAHLLRSLFVGLLGKNNNTHNEG